MNLVLVVNPLGVIESDGVEVGEAVIGSSVAPELMADELLYPEVELRMLVRVSGGKALVSIVVVVLSAAELVGKGSYEYGSYPV